MYIVLALLAGIVVGAISVIAVGFIIGTVGTVFIRTIDQKHLYQWEIKDLDKLAKSKFVIFKVDVSEYRDEDAA